MFTLYYFHDSMKLLAELPPYPVAIDTNTTSIACERVHIVHFHTHSKPIDIATHVLICEYSTCLSYMTLYIFPNKLELNLKGTAYVDIC